MRRFTLSLIALLCVTGCGATAAQSAEVPKSEIGRYQIVNGTPASAPMTMLLDTQTGRTWQVCARREEHTTAAVAWDWCQMEMYGPPTKR